MCESNITRATKNLVLFDFDGTITRKDSFLYFILFCHGYIRTITGFIILSPIILAMKLKLISRSWAKEIMFSLFFKGMSVPEFVSMGNAYVNTTLNSILRSSALKKLNEHLESGDRVIVVTASSYAWIKPWTDKMKIELIATHWEVDNQLLTGRISGFNCNGAEKVRRLREVVDLESFNTIYAYGDTSGDLELLEIATHQMYRLFKD